MQLQISMIEFPTWGNRIPFNNRNYFVVCKSELFSAYVASIVWISLHVHLNVPRIYPIYRIDQQNTKYSNPFEYQLEPLQKWQFIIYVS